jgi:diguanylate cyclase (GGDEF)-like protein
VTHVLPRLTGRVFRDLAIWMVGLGLCTGVAFPFFVVALGVPAAEVLTPSFFAATLGAGLLVGAVNHRLARTVVGSRLRLLRDRMATVEDTLRRVTDQPDAGGCDPGSCSVAVDSDDELGEVAGSFNSLIDALAASHAVNEVHRRVATVLSSHLELDRLAPAVLTELRSSLPVDAAALCLHRGHEFATVASTGFDDASRVATSDPVTAARRDRRPIRVEIPDDLSLDAGVVGFRPRTVLAVPLQLRGVCIGVLVTASTRQLEGGTERLLGQLAPNLAVALHNGLSHENLQQVAARDALTGVYNRRFGLERLAEEFQRAVHGNEPLGLLLFDIDHFKAINDTHGHQVGDRVLVTVAERARAALREGDVLVRFGGEEFLAVLPGAGAADIAELAERIRAAVGESTAAGGPAAPTVSVGAVSFPYCDAEDVDDLIRTADAAMYLAKSSGRNRVVVATADSAGADRSDAAVLPAP